MQGHKHFAAFANPKSLAFWFVRVDLRHQVGEIRKQEVMLLIEQLTNLQGSEACCTECAGINVPCLPSFAEASLQPEIPKDKATLPGHLSKRPTENWISLKSSL